VRIGSPTARDLVVGSQVALMVTLAVCLPLMPHFLFSSDMGGTSNYGVHTRTVAPYTIGILTSAVLLIRAAAALGATGQHRLALVARATAVLFLADLVSTYPYKLNPTWRAVHTGCGIALAGAELLGAIAVARLQRDPAARAATAVVVAAFTVLALTFFGALHLLFAAELALGAGFGFLLVRATAHDRAAGG